MNLTESGTYTRGVKAILFNRILVVLAFIGLFVAGALSLEKVLNITLPCGNNSGCDIVASDPSSSLFGVIPVAYIGFFGYVLMAALAIARTMKTPYDLRLVTVGYAASGIGAAFSVYLQFISLTKIHAICPYCLTSAITMLLTLVVYALLALEVKKGPLPEREMGKVDLWLIAGIPFLVVVGLTFLTGATKAKTGVDVGKIEMNEKSLVPENPNSFGHADAPITIIEFADMCCPACQKTSPKVKEFAADNPSTVRLVYRHFPLKMHALGSVSAAMGEYAAEKGRFWDFMLSVMGLMRQPESLQELLDIAKSLGMDPADIKKRLSDKNDPVFDRVTRDMNVAHKLAIDSTPTFIILAKGLRPDSAGPSDVMDKLNGPIYKRILLGNG
jgi:protein-disulfide isomerase